MATDPTRTPVLVAGAQITQRDEILTAADLLAAVGREALDAVPALADRLDRLSVVNVLSRTHPAVASETADRLGIAPAVAEITTIGGNSPQWLVTRAAREIAAGALGATLIVGAEALHSSRRRRAAGEAAPRVRTDARYEGRADPVVGDDTPGIGPAESAAGVMTPVQTYPILESAIAARAGRTGVEQREVIGALLAPFSEVAAGRDDAWFPTAYSPEEIAHPGPDNRMVADPYTKRMTAFLGSDQAAALVVCSLAEARRAGVEDRAVFIWSGADTVDVRYPSQRPDLAASPAIAAAGRSILTAAGVGIDDVTFIDLYSCFPSAVEMAADALGLAFDDPRGLTVTGGLPYFGGPGNNYTAHAIATVHRLLLDHAEPALALTTGLGWFVTKHALGLYGTTPPPGGFVAGDTAADQAAIDASALALNESRDDGAAATVVGATVLRDAGGAPTSAPAVVELEDGTRTVADADGPGTLAAVGASDVCRMVGSRVVLAGDAPRYRLPD